MGRGSEQGRCPERVAAERREGFRDSEMGRDISLPLAPLFRLFVKIIHSMTVSPGLDQNICVAFGYRENSKPQLDVIPATSIGSKFYLQFPKEWKVRLREAH